MKWSSVTGDMGRVSPLCGFYYVCSGHQSQRRTCASSGRHVGRTSCHTGGKDMVSLQYEFESVSLSYLTQWKIVHSWSREKVSCRNGSGCVSLGYRTRRKTWHKHCKRSASLQYGFFHETSFKEMWRNLYHILDSYTPWSSVSGIY